MKIVIALATVLAFGLAMPPSDSDTVEWENYKQFYGKSSESTVMDTVRKSIYFQTKDKVEAHNKLFNQGLVSYSLKLNHFADRLPEELPLLRELKKEPRYGNRFHKATDEPLPDSVDWRAEEAVTPVKDQGPCVSGWAFSATGSVEGQMALTNGILVSLSEQQLVDCSSEEGNQGCDGGLMDPAFAYIITNEGIGTEESYPYTAEYGACSSDQRNVAAIVTDFFDIKQYDEADLQIAVAFVGPVSIAIDATAHDFLYYSKGVYNSTDCSSSKQNHGVLAVGYGTDSDGTEYWLVKNSWGTSWGESGYIRMSRNKNNQCGVATTASFPVVADFR